MDSRENDIRDMRDENVIRQLWESSEGKVSSETMQDLEAVHEMIAASEGRRKTGIALNMESGHPSRWRMAPWWP